MKSMRKPWAALAAGLLLAAVTLTGCAGGEAPSSGAAQSETGSSAAAKTDVNVFVLKGPTGVGMVNLWKAADDKTAKNNYTIQALASPDDAVAKITNGEADIAAIPTNLAAVLYNKTGKVRMLAVNTLGVLHILENGTSVQKVADLKGKTIYSTGQGSNPEFVLNYILQQNGLDPKKDVTIKFVTENDELATLLATGEAKVALVPEPTVTAVKAKNSGIRVALDMTKEWDAVAGGKSSLMMGCVVANADFAAKNGPAVEAFLAEYKASVEKAVSDLDATAALCETYGIIPKAAVAKQAIPGCNLKYVDGVTMKEQIKGFFGVLYAADPKSVGGKIPDDTLYTLG